MNDIVSVAKMSKTYDGKRYILNKLDFSLKQGEIATIYGASGSGKSTFLNIIGLLDSFSEGHFEFNKKMIKSKHLNSYNSLRANYIGFVFQSYYLIDALTVMDNVLMPFMYNNLPFNKSVFKNAEKLLQDFKLEHVTNQKASLLSGGEKQRVAIIRAILKKPLLLIADEPTGNLDDQNSKIVIDAFNKIANNGGAVIIVTHNKNLSFGNGRKYNLEEGKLIEI